MEVREATPQDLNPILQIISEARQIMRETGNTTQWNNGYPSPEIILQDIKEGHAFVCHSGDEITGYFCLMAGNDPDPHYKVIQDGNWLNDAPYGVIHRLASGRKTKGIAQKAFDFAFSKIDNVRVDTHHENVPMQRFLAKTGFIYCGIIYVNDGTPRDAFQKQIS